MASTEALALVAVANAVQLWICAAVAAGARTTTTTTASLELTRHLLQAPGASAQEVAAAFESFISAGECFFMDEVSGSELDSCCATFYNYLAFTDANLDTYLRLPQFRHSRAVLTQCCFFATALLFDEVPCLGKCELYNLSREARNFLTACTDVSAC